MTAPVVTAVRSDHHDQGRYLKPALAGLTTLVLVIIVGLPVTAIVLYAVFPHINEWSFAQPFSVLWPAFSDTSLIGATVNSLGLAMMVTLLSCVIALPLAYQRSHMHRHLARIWDALFLVPFLIPPYIGALAWMQLLQVNGFVEQIVGFNLAVFLYSFPGIVTVMALHLFPMIYFACASAFSMTGMRYGEVARVFGGRSWKIFFRIHLPMILPSLLASGLIVFILTIEEFGTPDILGSRFGFQVMVTAIHEKFSDWPVDLPGASVLSLVLIVIAFAAYWLHRRISERFNSVIDHQVLDSRRHPVSWLAMTFTQLLFAVVFMLAVMLPVMTIGLSAFMKTLSGGLSWGNFSADNIIMLFHRDSDAWAALSTSLVLALAAAVCAVIIAILVAFATVRLRVRGIAMLDLLSILPNSIPGMAIAVGLILTWNQRFWPFTPYNTPIILLIAYVCLTLPYPIRMVTAALRRLPKSLDDAAYISGASELTVIARILTPLLAPVALAAGFMVFAVSSRELVSSLMLAPPGVETVATYVFHQFDQGSINAGMAMSLVAMIASGSIMVIGQILQGRSYQ